MRLTCITLLLAMTPLMAHHSPAAMYDINKIVTVQGTVTAISWMNPHAFLFLDVKDAGGNVVNWKVELPSPNGLMKGGYQKSDIKQGDSVTMDVWIAKDGTHLADMRLLTLPDGRTMSGKTLWDPPYNFRTNQ